jgi:hypothetical protein
MNNGTLRSIPNAKTFFEFGKDFSEVILLEYIHTEDLQNSNDLGLPWA